MYLSRLSIDRAALPTELLALAKAQMHIEFDRDDELIKSFIARAIDKFEMWNEFSVNPAVWEWSPTSWSSIAMSGGYVTAFQVPIQPQPALSAVTVDGIDALADWSIRGAGNPDTFGVSYLLPSTAGGNGSPMVTLGAGYDSLADLPPGILDVLMRATAWLYENREISQMPGMDDHPYLNSLLTGHWRPRV